MLDKLNKPAQKEDIGIRFEISKVNDVECGYGEACWRIFWQAVDIKLLAGTLLRDGDTNATPDHENVYCISITWPFSGKAADVKKSLEAFDPYRQVAASPNFIYGDQLAKELLVQDGFIDQSGQFVGTSYRALIAFENIQKKMLAKTKSNSVNDINFNEQQKTKPNASHSNYVSSCFNFDLKELPDSRVWSNIEELKSIPQKFYSGSIDEVRNMLKSAKIKYPDFDFVYCWEGIVGKKIGLSGEPNISLNEGLKKSLRKASICEDIGKYAFEAGNLEDAIRWLIRSCVLQYSVDNYYSVSSLLYLAYFANTFGMISCYNALIEKFDSLRAGQVRFDLPTTSKIDNMAQKLGTEDIRNAIKMLCQDYFL